MEVIGIDSKLKEKGLTLLEALVATAIVGIGFIAVFQMVNYSVRSIDVSGERTKSNYITAMIAEDLIGDANSKKGDDKLYEHLANLTDKNDYAWQNAECKPKKNITGNPYKDIKKLKVYEICRNNVKENGKSRPNCDYRNDDIWDKTYIGRMEILMPTTGTDTKGETVQKKKYLYFQMN
jgi:type II secretory pathway pseudopilin PulG